MSRSWVFTDVEHDRYVAAANIGPGDVDSALPPFSIRKRRLGGGLRDGVDLVEIDNGRLRLAVVPTRGMGLWRGECDGVRLGWNSPVRGGPVHPRFVPQDEASGIGWLSGFDEFLVRCGLEYCGAPQWDAAGKLVHPLHGRIANLPAHFVEASVNPQSREIALVGEVDEARLFCNSLRLRSTVRTTLGSNAFTVTDEITNLASKPGDLELLYHINQGPPLAGPGSKFFAAVQTLVPKDAFSAGDVATWNDYPAERLGPETVLFFELAAGDDGWTTTLLQSAAGDRGLALSFDRRQFPLFTLWKNPQPAADGNVTGLEPCINLPHTKGFERAQGRVATLAPGETRRFDLRLEVLADRGALERTRETIQALQRGVASKIFAAPQAGWSPIEVG